MTINYTTLLGLAKPVTGTESGTWGDVVNDQITSLVEDAIANAASLNVTSGNVTLTDNNGSSDQARMAILLVTGTPGVSRNIVAPSTSKWYIVKNGSNAEVVLKGSATTGVTIPAGVEALAFWNGSDFELTSMVGPSSSTDNAITRYDGTTGKVVQNSGVTIDDSNNMTGVVALTTTGVVTVPAGTNSAPAITTTGDTNTGIYFPAADQVAVTTGGTARVFVDSDGDVGIGTISPSAKLEVARTDGADGIRVTVGQGSYSGNVALFGVTGQSNGYYITKDSVNNIQHIWDGTGGNERMRIDSSGNLGLGVTPSAWSAGQGFQMKNGGAIASQGASFSVAANAYFASGTGWTYTTTSTATRYDQTSGAHQWFNAPSGTANNAITFTQAMTLTASGNLGIGATSPSGKLDVVGSGGTFRVGSAGDSISFTKGGTNYIGTSTAGGQLLFQTGASSDRMLIDSSGNVGIGTNSPSSFGVLAVKKDQTADTAISVSNAGTSNAATTMSFVLNEGGTAQGWLRRYRDGTGNTEVGFSDALLFTGSVTGTKAERGRFTSGGAFLVGSTTDPIGTKIYSNSADLAATSTMVCATDSTNNGYYIDFRNSAGANSGRIEKTGTTTVAYTTTSDRRLKENVTPSPSASDDIDAIQIVSHDWKASPDECVKYGIIAQDLYTVAPQAVSPGDDGDEIKKTWGVDYSKLVPMLIKEIQSLRARVAQLETKGA